MQESRKRRNLLATALLGLSCVATVNYVFMSITIKGNLHSEVRFHISHGGEAVPVEEITVGELIGDDIWRLEGRGNLQEIVYGEVPEGFEVIHGPAPLEIDRPYSIAVRGTIGWWWWRRDVRGICHFLFLKDGDVRPERGC